MDYRGQIYVVMSNNGSNSISISKGERFAQLVIAEDPNVTVTVSHDLTPTVRYTGKFGSTGHKNILTSLPTPTSEPLSAAAAVLDDNIDASIQVEISQDPFHDTQNIEFVARGKQPAQGMSLFESDEWFDRVVIQTCKQGTATAKIPDWKKRLKGSVLLEEITYPSHPKNKPQNYCPL